MPPFSQYHVFSLPSELLITLTPRNLVSHSPPSPEPPIASNIPSTTGVRTCNICHSTVFTDVDDQRTHFRTDWHRYNVKARLKNGRTVTEAEFANLVDALEDSLSGSASSSDEDASSESDAVQTLLSKTRRAGRSPSPAETRSAPQSALAWFHSPPATQLGIYKAIFATSTPQGSYLSELRSIQKGPPEGRKWTLFMVAGGHFAGVVVRVSRTEEPLAPSKGKQKNPPPEMEILLHKTFHRYTTRRKQGGSQSVNDNAKGNAKSAGAQLRRYGEQALREDIRNLINEWADEIRASERIFLRASVSNRRIFWDYNDAVIAKGDERVRTFPFPTRRPTQSELSRCLMELTKVKVTHFTEEELRAQDDAYLASLSKLKPQPPPAQPEPKVPELKVPRLSKEEELLRDKWTRLLEMIKKGRLDAAKGFWEREGATLGGVDAAVPEWAGERGGTLLQVAALAGQEAVVDWLLDALHADPTLPVPSGAATRGENGAADSDASDAPSRPGAGGPRAYDLAATRAVRDVFRRCAAAQPERWDWFGAARVPSALSKEMEEEREDKKKVRRKGLKDKIREREEKGRTREKAQPAPIVVEAPAPPREPNVNGPRKLGGTSGGTEGVAGLTPEMRARVERERRARAAEARVKALTGGR